MLAATTRVLLFCVSLSFLTFGQTQPPQTLRAILLEQLRTTHNRKEWFVPVNIAIEGLVPEQAVWKDKSGNHSIGQLTNHLAFWNQRELDKFSGRKSAPFNGDNEETFNSFDGKTWPATVQRLDHVMTALEKIVEEADENKLREWSSDLAKIGTHNAYHTGQIIYIRRLQGSWDPEKGVK